MYGIINGVMDVAFWCNDNISFSNIFKSLNKYFFRLQCLKITFTYFLIH
jgi:hypothetical protein